MPALPGNALVGLAISAHNSAALNTATFTGVSLLQGAWRDGDIGGPGAAGNGSFDAVSGTWYIAGGGSDIWNKSDQFNYVSQTVTGNVALTAQVLSDQNTSAWAKARLPLVPSGGKRLNHSRTISAGWPWDWSSARRRRPFW